MSLESFFLYFALVAILILIAVKFIMAYLFRGAYNENKTVSDTELQSELEKAATEFEKVRKVKQDENRLRNFPNWNTKLETAFQTYMGTKPYQKVKSIIDENIEKNKNKVVFHEANSCPEFWEHTRLIAGINVAVPLLKGAQSLI